MLRWLFGWRNEVYRIDREIYLLRKNTEARDSAITGLHGEIARLRMRAQRAEDRVAIIAGLIADVRILMNCCTTLSPVKEDPNVEESKTSAPG